MPKVIFGRDNGEQYRIPALINADGVLVAVADNGKTGADWGYIELAVSRSEDGGESWSEPKTIASPPARAITSDIDDTRSAFFIDPCLALAPNGDILLIVTFFPESKGVHNMKYLERKKVSFASFDGKKYPVIYDKEHNYYIVLSDGSVIDRSKTKTPYKVTGLGELYKKDEYVGNIYLNGAQGRSEDEGRTTFGSALKAPKRSYIFMFRSCDKGETWSEPVDLTPEILNDRDSAFLGVAPGTGLTLKSGRVIIPLYSEKGTVCIYSDDSGNTWQRNQQIQYTGNKGECTLIEAPDERLYAFGRDVGKIPVTVSFDNGIVWGKGDRVPFRAPKCQKNAIVIGDRVFLSHPRGTERENGVISQGAFSYDRHGNFRGIKWSKEQIELNKGYFAYSCMAELDDKNIAILYEDEPSGSIVFDIVEI